MIVIRRHSNAIDAQNTFVAPYISGAERLQLRIYLRTYIEYIAFSDTGATDSAHSSPSRYIGRSGFHTYAPRRTERDTHTPTDYYPYASTLSNQACGARAGVVQLPNRDAGETVGRRLLYPPRRRG